MKSSFRVRTIIFDLDNTLFDQYYSFKCALLKVQQEFPDAFSSVPPKLFRQVYYRASESSKYENGRVLQNAEVRRQRRIDLVFEEFGHTSVTHEQRARFQRAYDVGTEANRREVPGALRTIAELARREYFLGILTNGRLDGQVEKARSIGLDELIPENRIIASGEIGIEKPHPGAFSHALRKFSAAANETLMVGDSVETDIRGALDYGIRAVLYQPSNDINSISLGSQSVPVIHQIEHLLDILPGAT